MATWKYACKTMQGINLDLKLLGRTDVSVKLTRAMSGSGSVSPTQLITLTNIIDPKQELTLLDAVECLDKNTVKIPVILKNTHIVEKYEMHQMGIYAEDPDLGEILYIVLQSDGAESIPSNEEIKDFTLEWYLNISLDNANNVEVVIDETCNISVEQGDVRYVQQKGGDVSDTVVTFEEADKRENIESEEKLSTIFGKIKKFFTDLKTVAFTGSYNDLDDKPTIPRNIAFSNLQNACTTLGINVKSYTTEEFVKAMPFNTYVQFTHNKNDSIKLLDMPQDYATIEFQKGRTANYCRGSAVHTTSGTLFLYKYESSSSNNGWRKVITDQDSIGAIFLEERMSRPTSANLPPASGERLGAVEYFQASSKMITGKPKGDGHVLQMNWDNDGGWDSQLALINGKDKCEMQHRGMSNGTWGDWKTLLDSGNYDDYWRPIQDNLSSSDATASLSANQGRILKGYRDWKRIFKNRSGLSSSTALAISSASIFGGDYNEIMILVGTYTSAKYWTYPLMVYPGDIGVGDGVCYLIGYYLTPTLYGTACVRVSRTQITLEFVYVGGENLTSGDRTSLTVLYR